MVNILFSKTSKFTSIWANLALNGAQLHVHIMPILVCLSLGIPWSHTWILAEVYRPFECLVGWLITSRSSIFLASPKLSTPFSNPHSGFLASVKKIGDGGSSKFVVGDLIQHKGKAWGGLKWCFVNLNKLLEKYLWRIVYLLVKMQFISLQACIFTKNELLQIFFKDFS